jgi:choice-of-anchor B domain-containing protein
MFEARPLAGAARIGPKSSGARLRESGSGGNAMRIVSWLAVSVAAATTATAGPTERHSRRIDGNNVILHAIVDDHESYANVWGYTAPDGREYALLGCFEGTAIIDVTSRRSSHQVAFVPGPPSSWRELRTYGTWVYVVNETGGGLQIVSILDPENPAIVTPSWNGFVTAHTVHIDEASATAYVAGRNSTGGVLILRLLQPMAPSVVGTWDNVYVHDLFARGGRMYAAAIYVGKCFILDIANLASPSVLGVIQNYPNAFTHNVWSTDDGTHVLTTDEIGGAVVRMWDVSDPAAPEMTDSWSPGDAARSIPHNVHVDGDLAYVSYYTSGVRVLDISDPHAIQEVASYDTYRPSNAAIFEGCWGVFPYYPNSPGLFVASNIHGGLYVLELAPTAATSLGVARGPTASRPSLGSPRPNPASTEVLVPFSSPSDMRISAEIVDAAGRRIRRLADRSVAAGETDVRWDLRDGGGVRVAAGAYFLRITAGEFVEGRRVIVSR